MISLLQWNEEYEDIDDPNAEIYYLKSGVYEHNNAVTQTVKCYDNGELTIVTQ